MNNISKQNPPQSTSHNDNDLSNLYEKVINANTESPENTYDYVKRATKQIKENASKIFVAPGEGGRWKNWRSDLFLEEKMFPALFPYGIGGYMSSNMLKNNDMGFANYIKSRIMSADPKFRNDPSYVFFLLLAEKRCNLKMGQTTNHIF